MDAPAENIFISEMSSISYLSMSNSVFNLSFLALVVSEIIWGPKFTLGALGPLDAT